jgi:hypothetical protein
MFILGFASSLSAAFCGYFIETRRYAAATWCANVSVFTLAVSIVEIAKALP